MDEAITINSLARYWKLWQINPAGGTLGYRQISLTIAQEYVTNLASSVGKDRVQNTLLSIFKSNNSQINPMERALATLCLRCYVSQSILKECKKIDYLHSGNKQFTYRDLLPFVLNDDGEKLIFLVPDSQTQLIVDKNNQISPSEYSFFSVSVLQTFNPDLQSRMSLNNWAYLQTKQNSQLNNYLSDLGLKHISNWALLNRATKKQLERLSDSQCHIIEAYHAVYRRDRQQQQTFRYGICPEPTDRQLQEMLIYLQQYQISVSTEALLLKELNQIAIQLRRYDIWNTREYLDIYELQTNTYIQRDDLPVSSFNETDVEEQEFLQFLRQHLNSTLSKAIEQQIEANIQELQKSRKYAPFAQKYVRGLQLYYTQAMSLQKITPVLGMTSWNQARRILNPGKLLLQVRGKMLEQMLETILKLAVEKGLTESPPKVNYLNYLIEQIESYVDREIFEEASEEIRVGKNRMMNSTYAQALRCCIEEVTSD